jgi:hypothetical protein
MNMSALQYARPIRKNLLALGTMVLLISSIPALGQVPGPQSELPSAPSAKAESYSSQQSKTSLAGTDQTSSIESGRETLTEQADYFVPMTNRERWDHYAYSLVEPQAFLYPAVQAGLNQARNRPHEWGQSVEGYERRFGSAYGQHLIGSTVSNAIAFGLHEDNRYEHPEQAPRTRQIAPVPRTILFIEEGRGIDTGADEYQSTMDALPWCRISSCRRPR